MFDIFGELYTSNYAALWMKFTESSSDNKWTNIALSIWSSSNVMLMLKKIQ